MSFGKIKITNFGKRHFESKSGGTKITDKTPEDFEIHLNNALENSRVVGSFSSIEAVQKALGVKIIDGYAPFCKLIAIPNFTNAKIGSMPIALENYQYLRSGYSARTESELPVMSRWFELPVPAPKAHYLMIVVYSRAQLIKEHKATETKKKKQLKSLYVYTPFEFENDKTIKWGVVAILGQTHNNEEPMAPITMMRNALGVEEGGSGVPIDREKYEASVKFWSENAIVKS